MDSVMMNSLIDFWGQSYEKLENGGGSFRR